MARTKLVKIGEGEDERQFKIRRWPIIKALEIAETFAKVFEAAMLQVGTDGEDGRVSDGQIVAAIAAGLQALEPNEVIEIAQAGLHQSSPSKIDEDMDFDEFFELAEQIVRFNLEGGVLGKIQALGGKASGAKRAKPSARRRSGNSLANSAS